ncbi:FAD-dependent oxidoreductase [Nocardioides panzhihuensis]|uniref:NADP-dependent aldehyde dehydrogenase n=1 Tax=Nocardioides panzhihuensis TaxID=860243 RepID=A0A7Z0DK01_9ACTN|nr:NADP-dependent aldehyde dehydrogenase [Nocardioides panzhihuensis]
MARFDLAVIGAGPAGLSAAVTAAEHGLRVALVDAGTQPGGQFWRHPDEHHPRPDEGRGQHLWSRFTDLRTRLRGLESDSGTAGRVELVSGHQVWFVDTLAEEFLLHLSATQGETRLPEIHAAALVLCPGGYDRQLPVPGWDLPGVMAAGGVQALLKAHRSVAGRRAIVAGTGPFLLPVAAGLAEAGAEVVAVCEAGSLSGWARRPLGAAAVPSKALEAVEYAALLARHRIPYRMRTVVTAIHGETEVGSVGLGRLDRNGRLRTDVSLADLDVDLVAFGWGFTPSLELITAVGATTRVDVDESLVADVDDWQRTDVPGAYVAGEATGVGGALLAVAEGELAALAASRDAGRPVSEPRVRYLQRQIARGRRFAATMHRAHPVPTGWQDWLQPDTTVCRCEETTLGEICAATEELGATDARTVKLLARPGMGWCQGRVCGFAAAKLAKPVGEALTVSDLAPLAKRTFAAPVSLERLATTSTESDGATSHDNDA